MKINPKSAKKADDKILQNFKTCFIQAYHFQKSTKGQTVATSSGSTMLANLAIFGFGT